MSGTTVAIIVLLAIVLVVLVVAIVAASRGRRHRLPEESRQRYAAAWQAIRTRFIDDPRGAVTEADRMVVAMLAEQGIHVDRDGKAPSDLEKARRSARVDEGSGATEGLRTAFLHYQRIVDGAVGESTRKAQESGRREVAS